MIDPKELRIGNYFHDGEGVFRVEAIDLNCIFYRNRSASIMANDADPIELTPDWLKRVGYLPEKNRINIYVFFRIKIWLGHNGFFIYLEEEDSENSHFIREAKYVHNWQNIHFALTGEELDFKPGTGGI